jgi:REP element-mobilizing transposase RayT
VLKKLKAASAKDFQGHFLELTDKLAKGRRLWDKAYFVETIG